MTATPPPQILYLRSLAFGQVAMSGEGRGDKHLSSPTLPSHSMDVGVRETRPLAVNRLSERNLVAEAGKEKKLMTDRDYPASRNTEACRECGELSSGFNESSLMCGRCDEEHYSGGGIFDRDDGERG